MKKIALAVMRMQPMHNGHKLLIETMLSNSELVIIAIGSTQLSRTNTNPFSYEERREMIKRVFPNKKILTIPLIDIGAKEKKEWVDYVLGEVKKSTPSLPTDYYTGSKEDAYWFESYLPIHIVCREKEGRGINATEIREKIFKREPLLGIIPKEVEEMIKETQLWD